MTFSSLDDFEALLSDPAQAAQLPHDMHLNWSLQEKAQYLKNLADCVTKKGLTVHFTDRYYPSADDVERKKWELDTDENGRLFRPIPVGELDVDNNIYLNIKDIGFVSSFFTLLHLYGHRVQTEILEQHPDSAQAQHYARITKYVNWPKPLEMDDVYADYRQASGQTNADYEADFLVFEKEAFAFGLDLMKESDVPIDSTLQYAVNTYIIADFEEIQSWWANRPNKDGDDFNQRYDQLYTQNSASITTHYPPIEPKASPFSHFRQAENGVVVVRNNVVYNL